VRLRQWHKPLFLGLGLGLGLFLLTTDMVGNGEVHSYGLFATLTQNSLFNFLETYISTSLIPSQNNSTLCKNQNSSERVKSADKQSPNPTPVGLALHRRYHSGDILFTQCDRERRDLHRAQCRG
jgi:hypothetical protein